MSVRKHTRGWGCTIACNNHGCPCRITTGQVTKQAIRAYAKSIGWGRRQARDLCVACFEPAKQAAAERRAARDALRKMTPEQRREARNARQRARRAARRAPAKETT